MKKRLTFLLSVFVAFYVFADSYMTKNYYFNDFDGKTINDENSTLGGLNFANAVQNESVLAIDATNCKLYNSVLTITFNSPIDLSNNAMLTLEGKYDGLTLSNPLPEDKELVPRMYIKLIDTNNNSTGGNDKVYEFGLPMKAEDWTEKTLDMKTYPEEVDFSRIAKVQIVFQAQSSWPSGATFTGGHFLFDKIELGAAPATTVLTDYFFENRFDGKNVSDANQTTSGQSGKISFVQQDNVLDVFAETGLGAWQTYYQTVLSHPINLSEEVRRKVELHFALEGLTEEGKNTSWLRMRLYDVNGTSKIIEQKTLTEGQHELLLTFDDNIYTEGGEFDYAQIVRFAITSNSTAVTPGHIYLRYLKIGNEEVGTTTQTGALETYKSHFYLKGNKLYVSTGKFTGNETVDVYKVSGEKLLETAVSDMPLVLVGQGMYIVRISGEGMMPIVEKVMQR